MGQNEHVDLCHAVAEVLHGRGGGRRPRNFIPLADCLGKKVLVDGSGVGGQAVSQLPGWTQLFPKPITSPNTIGFPF